MRKEDFKVWNSEKVDKFLNLVEDGEFEMKQGPFHNANPAYRKPNIVYEYSDHEINEIAKCASDVSYFAKTYAQVLTDDGVRKIKLRDYQKDLITGFQKNRFNICLASR